jgi:hypothetical protein
MHICTQSLACRLRNLQSFQHSLYDIIQGASLLMSQNGMWYSALHIAVYVAILRHLNWFQPVTPTRGWPKTREFSSDAKDLSVSRSQNSEDSTRETFARLHPRWCKTRKRTKSSFNIDAVRGLYFCIR